MRRAPTALSATAPVLGLALVAGGCGLLDTLTEPSSLTIQRFEASPEVLQAGGESVVTWNVAGADLVEIDNGVGPVRAEGSIRVTPRATTTYTLIAIAGASRATASIRVVVEDGSEPTPTPEPTPEPTPSPTPEPTPTPTPEPEACGSPATPPGACALLVGRTNALPEGQCVELNEVVVDDDCPVSDGSSRVVSFTVTAKTEHAFLRWRKAAGSADALLPSEGFVAGDETTTVLVNDTVRGPALTVDLLDPQDRLLMSFTLRHR